MSRGLNLYVGRKPRRRPVRAVLICFTVLVALLLAALIVIPFAVMDMFNLNRHVSFRDTLDPEAYGIDPGGIALVTEDGLRLEAWSLEADEPKATLIFVSGIQNPSVTAYFPHARWLKAHGYSCVLLEMRAHGGSEDGRIALGMEEYMDVQAAVRFIKDAHPDLPVVAFGLSMGAATSVNAFGETANIDGLISLSSFSDWPSAFCYNMSAMTGVPEAILTVQKPFVWFQMGCSYGFDRLSVNPLEEIAKHGGRPILLMHSTGDTQVPYSCYEALRAQAPHADTFVREGDWHGILYDLYDEPEDDPEYADAILTFLNTNFP